MIFSQETLNRLYHAIITGEHITIRGCNSFGLPFETTGRLANLMVFEKDSDGKTFSLDVEFGESRINRSNGISEEEPFLHAFFDTIFSKRVSDRKVQFLIDMVNGEDGELIFKNPENVFESTMQNGLNEAYKLKELGLFIEKDDPVTEKLRKMIGQPIAYFDPDERAHFSILSHVGGHLYYGETEFRTTNGYIFAKTSVKPNVEYCTMSLNGKIHKVASISATEYGIYRDERFKKAQKARQLLKNGERIETKELERSIKNQSSMYFKNIHRSKTTVGETHSTASAKNEK